MNKWFLRLVQFECILIAFYHIFMGAAATFLPAEAAKLAPIFYGISLEIFAPMKPEYLIIIRFLGAFAFTFGLLVAMAALNPIKNLNIIMGAAIFFALRILDRVLGADTLISSFNTTSTQNMIHILLMISFVVILGAWAITIKRSSSHTSNG